MQTYNMPVSIVERAQAESVALDRVLKARHELILTRVFYAVLISHVTPVMSWEVDTAATDGRRHYWNPAFVATLTQAELVGVQVHESEHDARHHSTRRNGRVMFEWNVACDYAINVDIIAEGFTLPKSALLNTRFATMSAEEIYRTLELEKPKPEEPEQPEQDEQDDDEQDTENADTNPGNQPDEQDGDDSDTDSDNADSDDSTDGQGGDEQGDEPSDDDGKGTGEGEGDGEGEGTGNGEGTGGDAEGEGAGGMGGNDPGSCGGVLDAPEGDDGETPSDLDHEWEKRVRQAAGLAKAAGQLPGHVSREIERANQPVRAWRDELREFCEQGALRIETWNRPNRRFASQGIFLPSTIKDGVSKAAFVIDTSGSCDDVALACVQDEAQQLMDDGIVDEVVVVYGDTVVTRVDEYTTGDTIEFDPRGGGGTDMQPLFDYVAEEHSDATLVICFTDCEFYCELEEPAVPTLFAVHGLPQMVKQHVANPPFGRAIDVGVH